MKLQILAMTAATLLGSSALAETYRCTGTEPFWGLTLRSSSATFESPNIKRPIQFRKVTVKDSSNSPAIKYATGWSGGRRLAAFVVDDEAMSKTTCSDGMSDFRYPFSVYLTVGTTAFNGCCQTEDRPATMPE